MSRPAWSGWRARASTALVPFLALLLAVTTEAGAVEASGPGAVSGRDLPEAGAAARPFQRGRVLTPSGRSFDVEVVSDGASRERGLKYRTFLPEDAGMLFVFPAPGRHAFWMYECRMSLDIIWLDAGRKVVHIARALPPCEVLPCPNFSPDQEALYVLEVGPGVAKRAGIQLGSTLSLLFASAPDPT